MRPLGGTWQVNISRSLTFPEHGSDKDVLTEHELRVLLASLLVVGVVQKKRARERCALLMSLLHQIHLVVGEFHVDLDEFLEEGNILSIVVDLSLCLGDVGGMRALNGVTESVHLDPAVEQFFAPRVRNPGNTELFYDG